MSRDALTVLREVRANYAGALLDSGVRPKSVEYALQPLDEAIAQVEALVDSHASLLDLILTEAEARDYNPPADTTIVADAFAARAPFTPGQDSEGSPC